ncbi:MAG: TetR/AcrR family transcriptional regulator [Planctomycetota bacterium]|nr:TetR/AcrR family transcriptional regulator [Planctomycetota bacterium]
MTEPSPQEHAPKRRPRGRPPNPELRTAKHGRMLQAALKLFIQRGYDQVTVEQIARVAGQSKGAFYWYFKDKEECLRQIFDSLSKHLDDAILKIVTSEASARDRLKALSDFRNWTGKELVQMATLMNSLAYSRTAAVRELAMQHSAAWMRNGSRMVADLSRAAAQEAGWNRAQVEAFDFEAWTFCYVASYNGVLRYLDRRDLPPPPPTDRIADAIHEAFIHRLLSPREA